jgi:hypothetical protein
MWIPSHVGLVGNELVDERARHGKALSSTDHIPSKKTTNSMLFEVDKFIKPKKKCLESTTYIFLNPCYLLSIFCFRFMLLGIVDGFI